MALCCLKGNALAELKCFEEMAPHAHPEATGRIGAEVAGDNAWALNRAGGGI
jgi:hypothetical protein